MTDQISSLDETLAVLQADREARKFDGVRFEAAVLQHAGEIPRRYNRKLCMRV